MNNPYYLKDTQEDYYYNKYPEFQVWEEGKQAGIKEVVGWLEKQHCNWNYGKHYTIYDNDLQSKLKEWGC